MTVYEAAHKTIEEAINQAVKSLQPIRDLQRLQVDIEITDVPTTSGDEDLEDWKIRSRRFLHIDVNPNGSLHLVE